MRALVVDDSRTMRRIVAGTLRDLGLETTEAENGAVALALLEDGLAVDLACIDWNMPVLDGLEFVTQVRARGWRAIALMMVTTESEQGQIVRALAAGAHEYLIKPFSPDALRAKLDLLGLRPAVVAGGAA